MFGALSAGAYAQERWAALSLLGDRLSVVYPRMQTGTRLNPNAVHPVPVRDGVLDRLVLQSLFTETVPGVAEIVPLSLRDPRLYESQDRLLGSDALLREGVLKAIGSAAVTHLLLVVKARAEASFNVKDGHIGIGQVEGLGFFVDRSTQLRRDDTGQIDVGYLAPFAYYRLMLYDIARGKVVGDETVTASMTYPVAGSGKGDPWDLVSASRKVEDVAQLLNRNTTGALRRLVAARARN